MKLMIELEEDERVVVKNWRDFLIHKLEILFASNEHSDLELVFQDGKTIKVHSLVLNVSTDFFRVELQKQRHSMKREHREASIMGRLIMPTTVTSEATETLVKFAYTGRLEGGTSPELQVLQKTAKLLGMVGAVNALDKLNQRLGSIAEEKKKASSPNEVTPKAASNVHKPLKEAAGCSCSCRQADCHKTVNQNKREYSTKPLKEVVRQPSGKPSPGTKPKPPRSLPSTRNFEPVKALTSSEVFQKYVAFGSDDADMFDEETKRKIAETVSKHPHIMRWDGTPVKVRLKVKTDSHHLRQIVIIVKTHVDDAGKKSLQIIRERDEHAVVGVKGPWNCKMCTKKSGDEEKILQFSNYQACRLHYETVHGQHFNSKICDVCGLKFSKRVVLAQHRYNKHNIELPEDIKLFKCEECDHMSVTRVCLEKHAIRMHSKKVSEIVAEANNKAKTTPVKPSSTKKPLIKIATPILKKSRLESVEVEEEEKNADPEVNGEDFMEVGEEEDDNASKGSEDASSSEDDDEEEDKVVPMTCTTSTAMPWQPAMSMYADACPIPALPNFQYSFTGNSCYNGASMPLFNGMQGPYMNPTDCQILSMVVPEDYDISAASNGAVPQTSFVLVPPQQQQQTFQPNGAPHQHDGLMIQHQHQQNNQQQQSFMTTDQMISHQTAAPYLNDLVQQQQQQQPHQQQQQLQAQQFSSMMQNGFRNNHLPQ